MKIDWNEAPEWADGHGEVHCLTTKKIWFNEHAYMYVGDSRSYQWCGQDADLVHNHGRKSVTNITLRPAPWTGEGLPPVGTVCEYFSSLGEWRVCRIVAHDGLNAVFNCLNEYGAHIADGFRAIRTPEQIAAEQYERDASELAEILSIHDPVDVLALAKLVLDCGYSKAVKP